MLDQRIGFIGSGQMATALARGFVNGQLLNANQVHAFDPVEAAVEQFVENVPGAQHAASNQAVVERADVVVLAIKPQVMSEVAQEVGSTIGSEKLLVSIAAGVSIATLIDQFGTERVVRAMPNTPCLVGLGAAGFSLGPGATQDDSQLVNELLSAVGVAFELKESLLDAVTGLSGSGPAYVFTIIESLSDGGVRMGLPRNVATALAAQTVLGAAAMVKTTEEHPAVLRDRVASPGGTTIAGLQQLEDHAVRAAVIAAVEAATNRSVELGQPTNNKT